MINDFRAKGHSDHTVDCVNISPSDGQCNVGDDPSLSTNVILEMNNNSHVLIKIREYWTKSRVIPCHLRNVGNFTTLTVWINTPVKRNNRVLTYLLRSTRVMVQHTCLLTICCFFNRKLISGKCLEVGHLFTLYLVDWCRVINYKTVLFVNAYSFGTPNFTTWNLPKFTAFRDKKCYQLCWYICRTERFKQRYAHFTRPVLAFMSLNIK